MCEVTMGHLNIGYLKATVVHIRVILGHLKVTIGYFFSTNKHKANTTELHPKVRQTCLELLLLYLALSMLSVTHFIHLKTAVRII